MEKITVVKIGGNVIDDPAALKGFLADFASLPGAKILEKRSFSACPCGNSSAPFWRWALRWDCISA